MRTTVAPYCPSLGLLLFTEPRPQLFQLNALVPAALKTSFYSQFTPVHLLNHQSFAHQIGMAIAQLIISPWTVVAVLVISYLYQHLITYRALQGIPGPLAARFSNLWLFSTARRGKRFFIVDQVHKKYGPMVRVQPNHVSINDDLAIPMIYGHGNGFLKSFVPSSLRPPPPQRS